MILEKPFFNNVSHIVAKDLKTNYDLILSAHIHHPYTYDKVINVGCLGRTEISEADIKPSVLLVEIDETLRFSKLALTSAKPGSEIFDLQAASTAKAFNADIENFVSSLKTSKIQGLNLKDLVTYYCNENNIENVTRQELLERISKNE
ncbi:MAG: hypothetical protein AABY22_10865 [Nanoarchaeota archaeon]